MIILYFLNWYLWFIGWRSEFYWYCVVMKIEIRIDVLFFVVIWWILMIEYVLIVGIYKRKIKENYFYFLNCIIIDNL